MRTKLNKEHYDFLIKCSKENNIEEWNKWHCEQRAINSNFKLQLREARLKKADLSGAHLECADLSGAYLSDADLMGAYFECADLSRAHLENAILTIAHLENADMMEAHMEKANLMGAHMENARLERTQLKNAYLEGAYLEHAFLKDTNMYNADLSHSYLNDAKLIDISFTDKKGESVPFNCKGALIRNIILSIKEGYNKKAERAIIKAISRAQLINISYTDPVLGRKVRDEAWLYNWKRQNSKGIKKVKKLIWGLTCNYGKSIWQWAIVSLLITLFFGVIILLFKHSFHFRTANGQLAHWYNAFYHSILTFTTLDTGVVTPKLTSLIAQSIIMAEVILGYIMLGGLVSILLNKLARRND